MNKIEYQKYINSEHWTSIRNRKIIASGNKCENCGFQYELEVHHKTYENLGAEKISDLMVLCARCHNDVHYDYRLLIINKIERMESVDYQSELKIY